MNGIFMEKLNQTLQKQNITQKQLSELTGITEQSISRYTNGSRTPGALELIKIANALDVSIDYLLGHINVTVEDVIVLLNDLSNDVHMGLDDCSRFHSAKLIVTQVYESLKEIRRKTNELD